MVDLVWSSAPGESDIEKALWIASRLKDNSHIARLLRDPDRQLGVVDRVLLAQFLEGDYRLSPGRKAADDRLAWMDDSTPAQQASQAVREEMAARRQRGERVRGQRPALIDRFAAIFGADPKTVANHLDRQR